MPALQSAVTTHRLQLRILKPNQIVVSEKGSVQREFASLYQAIQFAHSLSANGHRPMTIANASGKTIVEMFV